MAADNLDLIRSAWPGLAWPALPPEAGALALALQFQLDRTQWLSPGELHGAQQRQLGLLIAHAHANVPFHAARLAAAGYRPGDPVAQDWFDAVPLLTRAEVHGLGEELHCREVPASHGPVESGRTSGSTGMPIAFLTTAVTRVLWRAFNLRDQLWHGRDLALRFAAIRPDRGVRGDTGVDLPGWGPSTSAAYRDGPAAILSSATTLDRQIDWLIGQDPDYLLSLASNLLELARELARRGVRLARLRQACTYGDVLDPAARAECSGLLGVDVVDIYSAQEVGYVALQCPDHGHYHVQSEGLIVEILDEAGRACAPGTVGRVVVTTLHNFAMPLIRYDIGDYAEAGAPCPCGRGLPVISRILGRERNMALTPEGRRYHPSFAAETWMHVAPIRQLQLVQKSLRSIEARIVAARALEPAEEAALAAALRRTLGHPYEITVRGMATIPRTPGGKFEDFICEVRDAA
ncbi:MAG: phenylacetate--CoA ligase family protein [Burkholderiales bacterium]|nr:phenylacetate--CoA ligase family protein [Burkholderiales bacterium]